MALTIDAVELLHKEIYDMFVIASSDSDYTPLAIHLRESGAYVVGVGEKKTPESFQHSCDEFIFLEEIPEKQMEPNPPSGAAAKAQAENEGTDTDKSDVCGELHKLLEEIWESCGRIHFYCCVRDYFAYNPEIPPEYLMIVSAIQEPVSAMWQLYLKLSSLQYETWEGIEEILDELLLSWRLPQAG